MDSDLETKENQLKPIERFLRFYENQLEEHIRYLERRNLASENNKTSAGANAIEKSIRSINKFYDKPNEKDYSSIAKEISEKNPAALNEYLKRMEKNSFENNNPHYLGVKSAYESLKSDNH